MKENLKIKKLVFYLVLNFIFAVSLFAQVKDAGFLRNNDFRIGGYYQSWSSANSEQISQFVLPVVFIMPISQQLSLDLVNSPSYASLDGAQKNLSGLTDTRIRASYVTMENKVLLTGGVSLPTGQSRLEGDQPTVAAALAMNALDFRVPTLGQGLDIKASAAFAQEFGSIVLGGGVGYLMKGSFQPYKESDLKYNPGDEITATLGADKNIEMGSNNLRLTGDFTLTLYGKDQVDGKEVFKSGNKMLFELRSLYHASSLDFLLYLRDRTKGKNDRGLGSLSTETLNSNGNQLEIGSISYFPMNQAIRLKALLESKIYSKNEYESNGALVFGVGTGLQYQLSSRMFLDSQFKFLKGSLKNRSDSIGITGFEVGAMLRFKL